MNFHCCQHILQDRSINPVFIDVIKMLCSLYAIFLFPLTFSVLRPSFALCPGGFDPIYGKLWKVIPGKEQRLTFLFSNGCSATFVRRNYETVLQDCVKFPVSCFLFQLHFWAKVVCFLGLGTLSVVDLRMHSLNEFEQFGVFATQIFELLGKWKIVSLNIEISRKVEIFGNLNVRVFSKDEIFGYLNIRMIETSGNLIVQLFKGKSSNTNVYSLNSCDPFFYWADHSMHFNKYIHYIRLYSP